MANSSAAKKSLRADTKKRAVNNSRRNRIRTFVRKTEDAIKAKDEKKANEAFKNLEPEIMKGVTKKIYKLNTAARKLSRISAAIKKISTTQEKPNQAKES